MSQYEVKEARQCPMMLIHEVSRLMGDRIRSTGLAHPITQQSGQLLLMELAKKDGRTQLELVNATHMKAPTVSVSLQKMEKDGYVTRQPDEHDLRATRVFLTDKGRALDAALLKHIREEELYATVNLTKDECDTLVVLLNKIRSSLVRDLPEEREEP